MIKIGILGNIDISDIILRLYRTCNINLYSDNFFENSINERIFISKDYGICFLVSNIYSKNAKNFLDSFGKDDIILLNLDDKNSMKMFGQNKAKVITYGLNSKACITASSILEADYKTIQFCVQREIPTFSGKKIEQQEFPVKIVNSSEVSTVLAAITVALINDLAVEKIKSCVL